MAIDTTTRITSTLPILAPPTIGVAVTTTQLPTPVTLVAVVPRLGSEVLDAATLRYLHHPSTDALDLRAFAAQVAAAVTEAQAGYRHYAPEGWYLALGPTSPQVLVTPDYPLVCMLLGRYPHALPVPSDPLDPPGYKHRRPGSTLSGPQCYPPALRSRRPPTFRDCFAPKGMRDFEQMAFDVAGAPWVHLLVEVNGSLTQ